MPKTNEVAKLNRYATAALPNIVAAFYHMYLAGAELDAERFAVSVSLFESIVELRNACGDDVAAYVSATDSIFGNGRKAKDPLYVPGVLRDRLIAENGGSDDIMQANVVKVQMAHARKVARFATEPTNFARMTSDDANDAAYKTLRGAYKAIGDAEKAANKTETTTPAATKPSEAIDYRAYCQAHVSQVLSWLAEGLDAEKATKLEAQTLRSIAVKFAVK